MEITVSPELGTVLRYARDEAMRTGHYGIGTDHLMLGILRYGTGTACETLDELGIDRGELKLELDACLFRDSAVPWHDEEKMGFTVSADKAINLAVYESLKWGQQLTCPEHLLLALSRSEHSKTRHFLDNHGASYNVLLDYLKRKGSLSCVPDDILPKADEIARALEDEIRRAINIIPIRSSDIYS